MLCTTHRSHERTEPRGPQRKYDAKFCELKNLEPQRGKEPSVLSTSIAVFQHLLHGLLGFLALRNLLEGIIIDGLLEALEFESITSGHKMVIVYDLDKGLDLIALLLPLLTHTACDPLRVPLNANYKGVTKRMSLVAGVDGLNNDDLR